MTDELSISARFRRAALWLVARQPAAPAELVDLALEAALAGHDGDALLVLAGLSRPTPAEVLEVLPGAAHDLGIELPDTAEGAQAELAHRYRVREILAPIMADLAATSGPVMRHGPPVLDDHGEAIVVVRAPDGCGTGVRLQPDEPLTTAQQRAAAAVADAAIEATWAAWPPCPHHRDTHPLDLDDGHWVCRTSGRTVAPLGELSRR